MPDKTQDIQSAITMVLEPGQQVTLAELNDLLYRAYPALRAEDPRWVATAVSRMLSAGALTSPTPDAAFTESFAVRRPAR